MAAAMTRVGFEHLQLARIDIHCDLRNEASAAIPPKLGYTREATLRRRSPTVGETKGDLLLFSLFADEYPGTRSSQLPLEVYDALDRRLG
jgi:RimJ/RimL family protein N-acetyltransferase